MIRPSELQSSKIAGLETRLTLARCREIAGAMGYPYPPQTKPQAAILILTLGADVRGEIELLAGGGVKLARRVKVNR